MPEKNIIFSLIGREDISTRILYPLYRSKSGSKLMSLKVHSYIPSYPLVPWPDGLSVENTTGLNDAIIAKDESDNAQIHLHFLVGDERKLTLSEQDAWFFLRTCPLVNRGVPLFIDVLTSYKSGILGYLPFQKGHRLGIFWQFLQGPPQGTDWVSIIGDVEELLLPEEEQDTSYVSTVEMLSERSGQI